MSGIVEPGVHRKLPHGLVPPVPLRERGALTGPGNHAGRADVGLVAVVREPREAVKQILGIAQREAGDAPEGHVGVHGGRHDCLPGHGCATWRRTAMSTFA
jgi:hypothetical protein